MVGNADSEGERGDAWTLDPESTPEYPPGTAEYPPGTDGYFRSDETAVADAEESAPLPQDPGQPLPEPDQPFWARLGFDSWRAYIDEQKRLQSLDDPSPLAGSEVPAPRVPGAEVGRIGPPFVIETRPRQVNVKLKLGEGGDLDRAALLYGLRPSTLARLLVNRGVRAILEPDE